MSLEQNLADGFVSVRKIHSDGTSEVVSEGYNTLTNLGKTIYFTLGGATQLLSILNHNSPSGANGVFGGVGMADSNYNYAYWFPSILLLNLSDDQKAELSETSNNLTCIYNADGTINPDVVVGIATPYYTVEPSAKYGVCASNNLGLGEAMSPACASVKYRFNAGHATGTWNCVALAFYPHNSKYLHNGISAWKYLGLLSYNTDTGYLLPPNISKADGTVITDAKSILLPNSTSSVSTGTTLLDFSTGKYSALPTDVVAPMLHNTYSQVIQANGYLYYIDALYSATSGQNIKKVDLSTMAVVSTAVGSSYYGTLFEKDDYLYARYTGNSTSIVFRAYTKSTGAYTSGKNITVNDASWGNVPYIWDTTKTTNKWDYIGVKPYGDTGLYMLYRSVNVSPSGINGEYAEPALIVGDITDIEGSLVKVLYGAGTNPSAYTVNGEVWVFNNTDHTSNDVLGGDSNNVYINKDTSSGNKGMFGVKATNEKHMGNLLQFRFEPEPMTKTESDVLEVIYGVRTNII